MTESPAVSPATPRDAPASPVVWLASDLRRPPEDGLGLALSGGGTRAMLFHAGALLRLILEAALAELTPASLVPLLAHPLCRLGMSSEIVARGAAALEIGAWRGMPIGKGV